MISIIIEKLKIFFILLISFTLSPLIIFIVFSLVIYKSIIYIILNYKYGDQFKGFLDGTDSACNLENNYIINSLHILESDDIEQLEKYLIQEFSKLIKNTKFEKITYTRNQAYGYYFWKNNQIVTANDIVKLIENTDNSGIELNQLHELITDHINSELPKNNNLLCQVILVKKPIVENNIKANKYGMIFRAHHSLVDGNSLTRILIELSDNKEKINLPEIDLKTKLINWILLKFSLLTPIFFYFEQCLKLKTIAKREYHSLFRSKLSGEKLIAWKSDQTIIKTIKILRKKIPDTSFIEFILTAISDSFAKYFSKHSLEAPETIEIGFSLPIEKVVPTFIPNLNITEVQNNFAAATIRLPITYDGDNSNILHRLDKIKDAMKAVNHRHIMYFYWLFKVSSKYLPKFFLKAMLSCDSSTICFSNFIAHPILTFAGSLMTDVAVWAPNRLLTGITITSVGYNGKLSFGLIVDKELISKQRDLDEILNDIILNIKHLKESIK